jgi:hypothetical protein
MRSKRLVALLVALVLVLGFVVPFSAMPTNGFTMGEIADADYSESDFLMDDDFGVNYNVDCVQFQFDRLVELLYGNLIIPFGSDINPGDAPRVNFILPPEGDREYFLIGVEEYATPECIDFILEYTGIPWELALIGQATMTRQILPYYCGWYDANERMLLTKECLEHYVGIEPLQSWWGMGQIIRIPGEGWLTLGHPRNSSLTSAATAPHAVLRPGTNVFIDNTNIILGSIGSESFFEPSRDVSIINLYSPNIMNSTVQGGQINNFRAAPAMDDTAVSVRGFSGVQSVRIISVSATGRFPGEHFSFNNKIGTYPDGRSQSGDSGAALIRRMGPNDRAVLGVRSGLAQIQTRYGMRFAGIYTSVLRY